jgi:hypothetical protein
MDIVQRPLVPSDLLAAAIRFDIRYQRKRSAL